MCSCDVGMMLPSKWSQDAAVLGMPVVFGHSHGMSRPVCSCALCNLLELDKVMYEHVMREVRPPPTCLIVL